MELDPDKRQAVTRAAEAVLKHRQTCHSVPHVRLVSGDDGSVSFELDYPDQSLGWLVLQAALGCANSDFTHGLLIQLVNAATRDGQVDERRFNFALSMVVDLKPRDQIEAALGAQMAALQLASARMASCLGSAELLCHLESCTNTLTKLMRTYALQVETLKRYRSSGEQKVLVKHVTVHQGGQAIVGQVTHGGRGGEKKDAPTP